MSHTFSPADEGKQVVTADGHVLGVVVETSAGNAYVRPRAGLAVGCGSWLASALRERDAVRLDGDRVAGVRDHEIVVSSPPSRERLTLG